jgi:hypothetical protein
MKRALLAAAGFLALAFSATSANAQATRTWVSGVGDDANPCSRTAPCKTFAGAISRTAEGGLIMCLDPGGFGTVTITKSITIDCLWQPGAGILASGGITGVIINAGSTDKVTLRGLSIEGAGTTPGVRGVRILSAGVVQIDQCRIWGFATAPAAGIEVATSGITTELHVKDSHIYDNGVGATGGGIVFLPTGAGNVKGSLSRVELRDNAYGILSAGSGTGTIRVQATDVVVSGSGADGVRVIGPGGGTLSSFFFDRATISGNNSYGAIADGSLAHIVLGRSVVAFNNVGVAVSGGATVWSYGNNHINANLTSDGGPNAAMVAD